MPIDKEKMRILIVDDYSTMRRIIKNLLKQIGFNSANIEEAEDGTAALIKLKDGKFGLVISDSRMNPMSGLQLLKEMRASDTFASTPFIMITAEGEPEYAEAVSAAGANGFIVKPFTAKILGGMIEGVFGATKPTPMIKNRGSSLDR